jgi:hypothetical protein
VCRGSHRLAEIGLSAAKDLGRVDTSMRAGYAGHDVQRKVSHDACLR